MFTWFNDHRLGLFVIRTDMVPTSHCDSVCEIVKVDSNYYRSEKKAFSDIVAVVDPTSGSGLAVTLKKAVWAYSLYPPKR